MYKKNPLKDDYLHRRKAPDETSFRRLYLYCRKGARSRNLIFELTHEEHKLLTIQNCYYCGQEPKDYNLYLNRDGSIANKQVTEFAIDRSWIKSNGIDRLDNTIGYVIHNCVPCCFLCNQLKSKLSSKEFIQRCASITDNLRKETNND